MITVKAWLVDVYAKYGWLPVLIIIVSLVALLLVASIVSGIGAGDIATWISGLLG
jgi:hypothetical protein